MRLFHILLVVIVLLALFDTGLAAKDRKKKKQQQKQDDSSQVEEHGGAGSLSESGKDGEKDTRERVHALVERQEERKKDEEESSEEKDKDEAEEKSNKTIEIPRFKRSAHIVVLTNENDHFLRQKRNGGEIKSLGKAQEVNGGDLIPISNKPKQEQQEGKAVLRHKRNDGEIKSLGKAQEVNGGELIPIPTKSKQMSPEDKLALRQRRLILAAITPGAGSSNMKAVDVMEAMDEMEAIRREKRNADVEQVDVIVSSPANKPESDAQESVQTETTDVQTTQLPDMALPKLNPGEFFLPTDSDDDLELASVSEPVSESSN